MPSSVAYLPGSTAALLPILAVKGKIRSTPSRPLGLTGEIKTEVASKEDGGGGELIPESKTRQACFRRHGQKGGRLVHSH